MKSVAHYFWMLIELTAKLLRNHQRVRLRKRRIYELCVIHTERRECRTETAVCSVCRREESLALHTERIENNERDKERLGTGLFVTSERSGQRAS